MTEASLFFVIVSRGKANELLHKAQGFGAKGGTVLLGKGTLKSRFFDILGINQTQKEILLMAVPDHASAGVYSLLKEEFKLHKRFKGIAFCISVTITNCRADNNTKKFLRDSRDLFKSGNCQLTCKYSNFVM